MPGVGFTFQLQPQGPSAFSCCSSSMCSGTWVQVIQGGDTGSRDQGRGTCNGLGAAESQVTWVETAGRGWAWGLLHIQSGTTGNTCTPPTQHTWIRNQWKEIRTWEPDSWRAKYKASSLFLLELMLKNVAKVCWPTGCLGAQALG